MISVPRRPCGLIGHELSLRYGLRKKKQPKFFTPQLPLCSLLSALAGCLVGFNAMLGLPSRLGLSVIAPVLIAEPVMSGVILWLGLEYDFPLGAVQDSRITLRCRCGGNAIWVTRCCRSRASLWGWRSWKPDVKSHHG